MHGTPSKKGDLIAGVVALTVLFITSACSSDAMRIRENNEAARQSRTEALSEIPSTPVVVMTPKPLVVATNTPPERIEDTPTPLSAEIEAVDVRVGDCINSKLPEGIDIYNVEIVECAGNWQFRALNLFEVDRGGSFRGDGYFLSQSLSRCDRRYTNILLPSKDSWLLGDRNVTCLQQSFGIATTNPEKLDRLVGTLRLKIGECLNNAPETSDLAVEIVSCADEWERRVLGIYTLGDAAQSPGDDYISAQAQEQCDRRYRFFLPPSAESWIIGDRTLVCLQVSYGLSATNPEKLDTLVTLSSIKTGECFNDAPETDSAMVELVGCDGQWTFQALNSFSLSDGPFPGGASIDRQAEQECSRGTDFVSAPSSDTWSLGERSVVCLAKK